MRTPSDSYLRSLVRRRGLVLRRSRAAVTSANLGGYMVIEPSTNTVVAGECYSLSPAEVLAIVSR